MMESTSEAKTANEPETRNVYLYVAGLTALGLCPLRVDVFWVSFWGSGTRYSGFRVEISGGL